MTPCKTEDSQTQTEKIICPTCECLPEKETIALKQIRINQKLDETTSDAIVLPYYSLVPPLCSYDEKKRGDIESGNSFSNQTFIGAMSNKKGKSAVKKLYISVYGTVENVNRKEDVVLLKPLADYDKEGKCKKPCVSGLELLTATSSLLKEQKDASILGKRLIDVLLGNQLKEFILQDQERLEGIACSFLEEQTSCYDEQLNRVKIEDMQGKLVVGIIDYCLYDGGKDTCIGLHFIRILGEEEGKKVSDLVHKYYYG